MIMCQGNISFFICVFNKPSSGLISSSSHAAGTDSLDSLSLFTSIIHHFGQVLYTTSCVHTVLLGIGTSWLSNTCTSNGTSLMSSFLLLQQCLTCLVYLIWIVLEIGGRQPYRCCFVGCCFQDLFNMARSILVQFPSSFPSLYT